MALRVGKSSGAMLLLSSRVRASARSGKPRKEALQVIVPLYDVLLREEAKYSSGERKKAIDAQILQTQKNAENDAIRAEAERALAEGRVNNTATVIDRATQIGNRAMDRQLDAEHRMRMESEQRAIANAQRLEMQRQAQDRQLAMQEQR